MLSHRIQGSGPPLVLLNGGMMTIGSWEPLAAALAPEFRVIRCDFRGQLLTPGPYPVSFEEHAADVTELLDFLGVERAHLLGVSFGGEVALVTAAMAPERVETLTVITSTDRITERMARDAQILKTAARRAVEGGDGGEVTRLLLPGTFSESWLRGQPADFIEQRARVVASLPRPFFEGLVAIMSTLETLDLSAHLHRITAPTLIIGAELDRAFPPEHSRALAQAIRGAKLEMVRDSGHGAIIEQPEKILDLFRSFVASRVAGG